MKSRYIFPIFAVIYWLFPNNNPMGDSYDYAASVRYGEGLFNPHHLLYNCFNSLIFKSVRFLFENIDALRLMQFINGLFALLSLGILYKLFGVIETR